MPLDGRFVSIMKDIIQKQVSSMPVASTRPVVSVSSNVSPISSFRHIPFPIKTITSVISPIVQPKTIQTRPYVGPFKPNKKFPIPVSSIVKMKQQYGGPFNPSLTNVPVYVMDYDFPPEMMMYGMGGWLKKITKAVTSIPKRVAGAVKVAVTTPVRAVGALVTGGSVRQVFKSAESELRRTGAIPGDTRKLAAPVAGIIAGIATLNPAVGAGVYSAVGAAVQLQTAMQMKRTAGKEAAALQSQYDQVYNDYYNNTIANGGTPVDRATFDKLVNEQMSGQMFTDARNIANPETSSFMQNQNLPLYILGGGLLLVIALKD